ncbi:MAG: hypothetical protein ACFE91_11495 [Promethearchaeota archaeon]
MDRSRKILIISLIGAAIIIASISIIFIINSNIQKQESIHIEFIPKEMKSYPSHVVWLLLDIRTKNNDLMSNLSISIETNISIEMEYDIWENSQLGKVAEIFLYPNITHLDQMIEVEATASSNDLSYKDYAIIDIINWSSEISPLVEVMRDEIVSYLTNNHPEFKINESIVWEGFGNSPQILVVEHYLFKSEFWEMELARHVMIAPHDWVNIYLRSRSSLFPSWSGIINSWSSGNHTIIEIEPPENIFR